MPRKSSNPKPTASKTGHIVPEWAKKVKDYREKAKKTQVEVEKALKATVNTLSLVENGRREFTPTQRNLFFELIGQPEDSSIPTAVRDLVPNAPKKATKAAKPKEKRKTKGAKPAEDAKVAEESASALVPGDDIAEIIRQLFDLLRIAGLLEIRESGGDIPGYQIPADGIVWRVGNGIVPHDPLLQPSASLAGGKVGMKRQNTMGLYPSSNSSLT